MNTMFKKIYKNHNNNFKNNHCLSNTISYATFICFTQIINNIFKNHHCSSDTISCTTCICLLEFFRISHEKLSQFCTEKVNSPSSLPGSGYTASHANSQAE